MRTLDKQPVAITTMRVKDFTYYPLMSTSQCAFRVANKGSANTYHQCLRNRRESIEGYGFCNGHAAIVRQESGPSGEESKS